MYRRVCGVHCVSSTERQFMFGRLFGKKSPPAVPAEMIIVQLNARLQPIHRGEFFEDPLDSALKKRKMGEVSGGGTMQEKSGEVDYCDIELLLPNVSQESIAFIVETLETIGAPKGSKLTVGSSKAERPFGRTEGLAVYLNGTDLSEDVYKNGDSNFVHGEFGRLLGVEGRVLSYWQGPAETALYMYGASFASMKSLLGPFLAAYPLCQKCRIVQVA